MNHMLKNGLVFCAGVVVCFLGITCIHALRDIFFPLPQGLDFTKSEDRVRFIELVPLSVLLMVELAYKVGSFLGGLTIGYFSASYAYQLAAALGVLFTLANVLNVMIIPHPLWMVVLTMVTFIPMALLGCFVGRWLKGSPTTSGTRF